MYYFAYTLFFAALLASFGLNFLHYMHMFQLNSYNYREQLVFIRKNIVDIVWRHLGLPFAIAVMAISGYNIIGMILSALCFLLFIPFSLPKKAKKPLVFTPRVIRMFATTVVLYGIICTCGVLLGGFGNGIILLILPTLSILAPFTSNLINTPIEKAINRHYINDAKRIIKELPNLVTIGITGSYGKTSTKFILSKLLGVKYNVVMTPESYNTTLGVVKTVRSSLNATTEVFVCEMGAKNVGEIKEICDIVNPRHSMITAIGPQHLETFKTIENIIKTKFEIADCITEGFVVLNMDNPYISEAPCDKNVVSYGISTSKKVMFRGTDIEVSENGTTFAVETATEKEYFATSLIGTHNVLNIVGAVAMAVTLGVKLSELTLPIKRLECVPHRLQVAKYGSGDIIIDDAFNSNPVGAKAALDTLMVFNGIKILVTPGMVELGEQEKELNRQFGMQAVVCDYVALVGKKQALPIRQGLMEAGYSEQKIKMVDKLGEAMDWVNAIDTGGAQKVILLENDLPDNY